MTPPPTEIPHCSVSYGFEKRTLNCTWSLEQIRWICGLWFLVLSIRRSNYNIPRSRLKNFKSTLQQKLNHAPLWLSTQLRHKTSHTSPGNPKNLSFSAIKPISWDDIIVIVIAFATDHFSRVHIINSSALLFEVNSEKVLAAENTVGLKMWVLWVGYWFKQSLLNSIHIHPLFQKAWYCRDYSRALEHLWDPTSQKAYHIGHHGVNSLGPRLHVSFVNYQTDSKVAILIMSAV